jgi:hypothetical protein
MTMRWSFRNFVLTLTLSVFTAPMGNAANFQTAQATSKSATVSLSIVLPQDHIAAGQVPWVFLTVKNISSDVIDYPQDRVYVEGKTGEPPTTLRQRQLTNRRQPGEPSINGGGFEPNIEPEGSYTRKYDLSQLYDLSKPGKYIVYIEVLDAFNADKGKGHWERSPIATFEIQAPTQ